MSNFEIRRYLKQSFAVLRSTRLVSCRTISVALSLTVGLVAPLRTVVAQVAIQENALGSSIFGIIRDTSGVPVPSVPVSIRGPRLERPINVVTDSKGEFFARVPGPVSTRSQFGVLATR